MMKKVYKDKMAKLKAGGSKPNKINTSGTKYSNGPQTTKVTNSILKPTVKAKKKSF